MRTTLDKKSSRSSSRANIIPGVLLLALTLGGPAIAEKSASQQTLVKIDDFPITDLHFAVFAGQTGRNPTDAAGQISLLNELVNHFMIANSAQGKALADDPEVVAALEVARARLIAQAFIRVEAEKAPIDDAIIQARYDERYGNSSGMEYKARHILLENEEDAKAVIADLDKGGDFVTIAGERSTGPSKSVGGDLGWFEPKQMVSEFASATEKLEDGAYSKVPVKTQFGWHVILREQSRKAAPPSLDSVRDELTKELQQAHIAKTINEIKEKTRIEVAEPTTANE